MVLLHHMLSKISNFVPYKTLTNVDAAIKWTLEHGMVQQAYTMAQKLTITRVLEIIRNEIDHIACSIENEKDREVLLRDYTSALLALKEEDKKKKNTQDWCLSMLTCLKN